MLYQMHNIDDSGLISCSDKEQLCHLTGVCILTACQSAGGMLQNGWDISMRSPVEVDTANFPEQEHVGPAELDPEIPAGLTAHSQA